MSVGRTTRCFKIFVVTFAIVVFLVVATRHKISNTATIDEFDDQKAFINDVKAKLSGESGQDIKHDVKLNPQEEIKAEIDPNVDDQGDQAEFPFDDSMPGAYLKFLDPAPTNQSYCKYNYQFPYDLVYKSKDYLFPPELGNKSEHRVIYNVTQAHDIDDVPQVTYATHMTANFAYFIPQLLKQWEGLVTVAAFVPDLDVAFFLEQINQFCYCEPSMHRVSVHIVTHKTQPFSKKDIYFDRPDNCIPQDSSKISIVKDYDDTLIYPVNVVRNVARTSALTKYVLLSDIELMPSKGLASGFLEMVKKFNKTDPKEVFVVPIFEVEKSEPIPENKGELLRLLDEQKAVYFHGMVCKQCQKFPGMEKWMKSGYAEKITPFFTAKRQAPYHRWEPIFIGTNMEPLYSEVLSWEGLLDKMAQSLEMCLQNYNYTILDNAFLCHWPGIKKQKVTNEEWRADFAAKNNDEYNKIIDQFQERYKDIPACKVVHATSIFAQKSDSTITKGKAR